MATGSAASSFYTGTHPRYRKGLYIMKKIVTTTIRPVPPRPGRAAGRGLRTPGLSSSPAFRIARRKGLRLERPQLEEPMLETEADDDRDEADPTKTSLHLPGAIACDEEELAANSTTTIRG